MNGLRAPEVVGRLRGRTAGARFTDRGRSLVAAGLTLTVAGALLGFVDLVRIGLVVLLLPPVSVLMTLLRRPDVTVNRAVLPSPVPHGGHAEVIATVRQSPRRGVGACVVEDEIASAGTDGFADPFRQRFAVPALPAGGAARLHYQVTPQRRGLHRLGPLHLAATDPFGMAELRTVVPGTTDFVTLTDYRNLAGEVGSPDGQESTGHVGISQAGMGEPSVTVREYHEGDDPRRIHWSASARAGELLVRVDEQQATKRAVLVLDQRFRSGSPGSAGALDWSVETLASVAGTLAASGHLLHLVCEDRLDDPRGGDPASANDIITTLSATRPVHTEDPARTGRLREQATDLASEGGLLIVAAPAVADTVDTFLTGRPARSTGLAFLVHEGGAASPVASPLAPHAASGGWHAVDVDPAAMSVQDAWDRLDVTLAARATR